MQYYTIYLINGNKAEVYGNSITIDDGFLTIFDQNNEIIAKFRWAYMTGFTTN